MRTENDTAWLEDFLPLMRCPDTHQPLRLATAEECAKHGVEAALITEDGARVFMIDAGIPILLPEGNRQSEGGIAFPPKSDNGRNTIRPSA